LRGEDEEEEKESLFRRRRRRGCANAVQEEKEVSFKADTVN